ncbi:LuxR C-terminal-related transcriptional regulator [Streptosporangium longisporum]
MIDDRRRHIDDLVDRLGLPEGEIKAALDQLAKLDLLRPLGDGTGQLVDPHLGLKSLLLQRISRIEDLLEEFEEDRSAVLTLLNRYDDLNPGDEAGDYAIGSDAVLDRLRGLADRATVEWAAFVPGGTGFASLLAPAWSLEQRVRRRGVSTRTVYTDSIRNDAKMSRRDAGMPDHPAYGEELGDRARTVPSLPVHMVVIDRSVAVLPLDPDEPCKGVIQLSTPGALAALSTLFESTWERAVPLETDIPPNEHGLTPQERELLRLLSHGLTDDVIRRRLGVSLRTVRRMVADLFVSLGADSRFAAGYQAAKRGWL